MSTRMKRIALSMLISLAVVAGVYTSVQGAALRSGTVHGSPHVTAGLLPDVSHQRTPATSLNEYNPNPQQPAQHHGCSERDVPQD